MSENKTTGIRLLAPRQVQLDPEQAREAVALLSELLLDAAADGRGILRPDKPAEQVARRR